ncbi:tripartite tricarboxylate transporter substrate binding protein [Variovorax sp.]|uniref:Bug family tripartite tricarboxylate transporter substrate binding protein n=1 Tax=Variovorax sp. TaxID=1871043 RepID=UPI002D753EFA|nr:tripartite tricarboxylate transporter substrate binding protein [Variovorax sp.]HYP85309.1 tripartite tricarboxylate transporter substrate binding protein [Variovorax sp.]
MRHFAVSRFLSGLLSVCLLAAAGLGGPACAQQAAGPVTLIVPFPPGGVSDVLARALAPGLGQTMGRVVVVENLTGASGSIAADRFLGSSGNASQLLVGSPTETILAPLTIKAVKYRPEVFRMLATLYEAPLALYARKDLPASSVDELAALSQRTGANPLNYGSPGTGSLYHVVTENLRKLSGIAAAHIPYRGGAPLMQDLMSGTIDFTMLPVDNVVGSLVDSGKIKVLGVSGAYRVARYPQAPALDESRSARGLGHPAAWVGVFVAQSLPEAEAARLYEAVSATLHQTETRRLLEATGGTVPEPAGLQATQDFYAGEISVLQEMVRVAGVKPE